MVVHLAYIDPGTGSVIWQTAVGTVLGGVYVTRNAIGRIIRYGKARFGRVNGDASENKRKTDSVS